MRAPELSDTSDTLPVILRGRVWGPCTWNNPPADAIDQLKAYAESGCAQLEVGTNGTPHVQFVLGFKSPRTFNALHSAFPAVHWEKTRSLTAAIKYCSKTLTRAKETDRWGRFDDYDPNAPVDPLEGKDPYPWQHSVLDMVGNEPDERTIYWIYEEDGNSGKTTLAKHLVMKHDAIYCSGKVHYSDT